jgi:hypothetical protein
VRKIITVFSLIAMTFFTPAQAFDVGSSHYGNETLGTLTCNGHLTLNGTTIQDDLTVNGSLVAENVMIEEMHVNGQVTLKGTHINGLAEINGYLRAENTDIRALLSLRSSKLDLFDSLTHGIIIKQSSDPRSAQVVNLNNTQVYGDIVFEGGNGLVVADEDSSVEGEVIGGKIIAKEIQ